MNDDPGSQFIEQGPFEREILLMNEYYDEKFRNISEKHRVINSFVCLFYSFIVLVNWLILSEGF